MGIFPLPSKQTTEVPSRIFSPGSGHFPVANSISWQSPSLALFPPSLYTIFTRKFPFCPKLPAVTLLPWSNLSESGQRARDQRCLLKDKGVKTLFCYKQHSKKTIFKKKKIEIFCSINYSIWPFMLLIPGYLNALEGEEADSRKRRVGIKSVPASHYLDLR